LQLQRIQYIDLLALHKKAPADGINRDEFSRLQKTDPYIGKRRQISFSVNFFKGNKG